MEISPKLRGGIMNPTHRCFVIDIEDYDKITEFIKSYPNVKWSVGQLSAFYLHQTEIRITGSWDDINLISKFISDIVCHKEWAKTLRYQRNSNEYQKAREEAKRNPFRRIIDFLLGDWESRNHKKYFK